MRILMIVTSHAELGGTGQQTGVYLEEIAAPYYIFVHLGATVEIVSPEGGVIPLDPSGEAPDKQTDETRKFHVDDQAMYWLSHAIVLFAVKAEDFDAVYITGGHGAMWDVADNPAVHQLIHKFVIQEKPVAAVSQGVSALVGVRNSDGTPWVAGKHVTGYTNSEEEGFQFTTAIPFLTETRLVSSGALFSRGGDFEPHVVVEEKLITGQNQASAAEVARVLMNLKRK